MIVLKLAFHVSFVLVSSALRRIDMSERSHGACPHEAENATNAAKSNATILTMVDISIYLCCFWRILYHNLQFVTRSAAEDGAR